MSKELGQKLVECLAQDDFVGLENLLTDEAVFTAASPEDTWRGKGKAQTMEEIRSFFDPDEVISKIISFEYGELPDRSKLSYVLEGEEKSYGIFRYEHQVYFQVTDNRISQLRMLCSGFFKPQKMI